MAGCGTTTPKDLARAEYRVSSERVAEGHAQLRDRVEESERRRLAAQEVQRPFIAGNTMPLARELSMPEVLRRSVPVLVNFQRGPVDIETAMRQLSEASGIVISITPDALLPATAFGPRTGSGAPGSAPVGAPMVTQTRLQFPARATPLWELLDNLTRQGGMSWRPVPGGAEIYRVETRVFQLAGTPQIATTSASLGRNNAQGQSFDASSKSAFSTADQSPLRALQTTVEAMLTTGGRSQLSAENQTMVVTDTPASLVRVQRFIEDQNKIMSRRVRVVLEVIEVVDRDASDIGVDWSILYESATRALANTSPTAVASSQAARLALGPTAGIFSGSELVLRALSDVGVVVNRRFFPMVTTSGRPVTQAIRTSFNYIDQVQATTPTAGSTLSVTGTAPTVTQKEETVGTFVTMVPTAKSDDSVFLSISFDVTTAQPLVPFTVGSSTSSVTVQQKTIDGTGFIQELPVRSGQTVLVGGLESVNSQDTIRRIAPGSPLVFGGSNQARMTKTRMLLLVTAVAEEGV
jgi:type IVB pilus formation R64 PilN family outer membrane protein